MRQDCRRRTCIVDCYVTNEENPTEAQMVKMPVTVTQEAESDFTIGMPQLYVGVRCNIVEIGSDGRENTKGDVIDDEIAKTPHLKHTYVCWPTHIGPLAYTHRVVGLHT